MTQFKEGNTFGKGRPKGSKNLLNRKALHLLLNEIVEDFTKNYDKLSTNCKLRLLVHMASLYKDETKIEIDLEPRLFNIEIISNDKETHQLKQYTRDENTKR